MLDLQLVPSLIAMSDTLLRRKPRVSSAASSPVGRAGVAKRHLPSSGTTRQRPPVPSEAASGGSERGLSRPLPALPADSLAASFCDAVAVLQQVGAGRSLAEGLLDAVDPARRPEVQDMVYASLRRFGRDAIFLTMLLERPLDKPEIHALLRLALYRLESRPETGHTVVSQAVDAAGVLSQGRLGGLVNAVLRNFSRRQRELLAAVAADPVARSQHPRWWLRRLQQVYPQDWERIVAASNSHPPMALRVNPRQGSREDYLARLADVGIAGQVCAQGGQAGILLTRPVAVEALPGFAEGAVSVQDLGAQRAAELLAPATGSRVLDACAAPGGKTAHLLEQAGTGRLDVLALDVSALRCRKIDTTLKRLGLAATVKCADASQPAGWWDGVPFDAILADVPCSASGVVRRHPDAKWLRRETDVMGFAAVQARLLDALWPLLKPGGRLLYATCSLFPEENGDQITRFLVRQSDARCTHQEQLLPCSDHDGFFYALLHKHEAC